MADPQFLNAAGASSFGAASLRPVVSVSPNNFIFVQTLTYHAASPRSISAVTDTVGNVYSKTGALSYAGAGWVQYFWTPNPNAGTNTSNSVMASVVGGLSADGLQVVASVWSWDATLAVSLQGSTAANPPLVSGTAITSPTISTSFADSLILGVADWDDTTSTYTNSTGIILYQSAGTYFVYELTDAPGAYTWTIDSGSAGARYHMFSYAFHQTPVATAATPVYTQPLLGAGR